MKYSWNDINVGHEESFEVKIDESMVGNFIGIFCDDNPLHTNSAFAKSRGFKGKLVHGMFLTSFFSRLVGKYFLGDNNLYLSQSVLFKKPVYVNDSIVVYGLVLSKSESTKTLEIKTAILNNDKEEVISGVAIVKSIS